MRKADRRMADEAVAISTELGDESIEGLARRGSALVAIWEDPSRALDEYNRAIPLLRTHHLGGLALALSARAVLRGRQGDGAGAQRDLDEAHLTWRRYVGPSSSLRILTLVCASDVAFAAGDLSGAEARAREAVDVALNADDVRNATTGPLLILPLEFLAHLAALVGQSERAALLSGFTDRRREETGIWPRSWFKLADRTWLADVEHRLGKALGPCGPRDGAYLSPRRSPAPLERDDRATSRRASSQSPSSSRAGTPTKRSPRASPSPSGPPRATCVELSKSSDSVHAWNLAVGPRSTPSASVDQPSHDGGIARDTSGVDRRRRPLGQTGGRPVSGSPVASRHHREGQT